MSQSLTISETGKVLTITEDGVTYPADYRFSTVNDFVHSAETGYEDMQGLCLGMADRIEKLQQALHEIAYLPSDRQVDACNIALNILDQFDY